jgi:hypothetical protein
MNTVEDKLKTALWQTGEEISPHSVPPLRLHGARRTGGPRVGGSRRWLTRLTPLAAAASVAAVVAASLAVSGTFQGRTQRAGEAAGQAQGAPAGQAHGAPAGQAHGAPAGSAAALHDVPPYYVDLVGMPWSLSAEVRATTTGAVLATIRPPRPFGIFNWVSGASDDRTFVLAAQRYWPKDPGASTPLKFFRLRFNPADRTARLTALTLPGKLDATQVGGIGLSPDGSKLALDLRQSIQIITLATGAKRQWVLPGGGWAGNFKPFGQPLSWTADGQKLAFQQWGGKFDNTAYVRILDTSAPGTSLLSGKLVAAFPGAPMLDSWNTLITPDGTKIVAGTMTQAPKPPYATKLEITEFSARTGKVERSLDTFSFKSSGGHQEVLWTDPSGATLIVSDPRGSGQEIGVLRGDRFTPLPRAPQTAQIAW